MIALFEIEKLKYNLITWLFLFLFCFSGSVLVYAKNAESAKRWADPNGIVILNRYQVGIANFDKAMSAEPPSMMAAIAQFYVGLTCSELVQPYIRDCQCRQWFADASALYEQAGEGLATGNVSLKKYNDLIIRTYETFTIACVKPCKSSNWCESNVWIEAYCFYHVIRI